VIRSPVDGIVYQGLSRRDFNVCTEAQVASPV